MPATEPLRWLALDFEQFIAAPGNFASLPAVEYPPLAATLLLTPLSMAYDMAPVLVVTQNMLATEAMMESLHGCACNIVPFLLFAVCVVVLFLLASLPLFLGWLVALPMMVTAQYGAYRSIFLPRD